MPDCTCNQIRAPKCPEGERLYQAAQEAYEAVMSAGHKHKDARGDYEIRETLQELRDAEYAHAEARKAWLDHKSTTDSERFMERAREFSNRGENDD